MFVRPPTEKTRYCKSLVIFSSIVIGVSCGMQVEDYTTIYIFGNAENFRNPKPTSLWSDDRGHCVGHTGTAGSRRTARGRCRGRRVTERNGGHLADGQTTRRRYIFTAGVRRSSRPSRAYNISRSTVPDSCLVHGHPRGSRVHLRSAKRFTALHRRRSRRFDRGK